MSVLKNKNKAESFGREPTRMCKMSSNGQGSSLRGGDI